MVSKTHWLECDTTDYSNIKQLHTYTTLERGGSPCGVGFERANPGRSVDRLYILRGVALWVQHSAVV